MTSKTDSKTPKFLTKTRALIIIAVYSPFFGYSYLKGYLHGAGFTNPNLEATPQELVFQALTALNEIFSRLVKADFHDEMTKGSLKLGAIFAAAFTIAYVLSFFVKNQLEKNESSKPIDFSGQAKKFCEWLYSKPKLALKLLTTSTIGFISGFLLSYITLFLIFSSMAVFLLLMILGNIIGEKVGLDLTKKDICTTKEWQEGETRRLGCNIVSLKQPFKGKSELKGWRLYSSPNTLYLLTNDGAFEIGSDLTVKLFTPNQKNGEEKSKNP